MSEKKATIWDINAKVQVLYKGVQFAEPLSKEDAIEAFLDGDYEDIADEQLVEVEYVYDDEGTEPTPWPGTIEGEEDEDLDEEDEYDDDDDEEE